MMSDRWHKSKSIGPTGMGILLYVPPQLGTHISQLLRLCFAGADLTQFADFMRPSARPFNQLLGVG